MPLALFQASKSDCEMRAPPLTVFSASFQVSLVLKYASFPSVRFLHTLPAAVWAALLPIQVACNASHVP